MNEATTEEKTKRRPGIPHETLKYIVEQAGGSIEYIPDGTKMDVKVTLGFRSFRAPDNTRLLISMCTAIEEMEKGV
jgi:hypothetical protein